MSIKQAEDADIHMSERQRKTANLAQRLLAGELDLAAGRTRPVEEFLEELDGGEK